MPPFYEISVASFRQPSSSKSRWAIAVVYTPSTGHSLVYQVVGSNSDYSLDVPRSVTLKDEKDYAGKVPVGLVDAERLHHLHSILAKVRVEHGNPAWNSHNWVMDGIAALRQEGYHIDKHVTSQQWVLERLGEK